MWRSLEERSEKIAPVADPAIAIPAGLAGNGHWFDLVLGALVWENDNAARFKFVRDAGGNKRRVGIALELALLVATAQVNTTVGYGRVLKEILGHYDHSGNELIRLVPPSPATQTRMRRSGRTQTETSSC